QTCALPISEGRRGLVRRPPQEGLRHPRLPEVPHRGGAEAIVHHGARIRQVGGGERAAPQGPDGHGGTAEEVALTPCASPTSSPRPSSSWWVASWSSTPSGSPSAGAPTARR